MPAWVVAVAADVDALLALVAAADWDVAAAVAEFAAAVALAVALVADVCADVVAVLSAAPSTMMANFVRSGVAVLEVWAAVQTYVVLLIVTTSSCS